MTTASIDDDPRAVARAERAERQRLIGRLSARARKAEVAYETAVADRDAALIECHGDKREGRLSYEELAQATGRDDTDRISKGRVIQIVQGKSEYSKRQRPAPEE